MSNSTSDYDEEWGTDYEWRMGIAGGEHFAPLAASPGLTDECRERLMAFQHSLPQDVYGFMYETSAKWRDWIDNPQYSSGDILGRHRIANADALPPLTLLVVLGETYYFAAESNRQIISQIISKANVLLRDRQGRSVDLIVLHRNSLNARMVQIALGGDEIPDRFYRLR